MSSETSHGIYDLKLAVFAQKQDYTHNVGISLGTHLTGGSAGILRRYTIEGAMIATIYGEHTDIDGVLIGPFARHTDGQQFLIRKVREFWPKTCIIALLSGFRQLDGVHGTERLGQTIQNIDEILRIIQKNKLKKSQEL